MDGRLDFDIIFAGMSHVILHIRRRLFSPTRHTRASSLENTVTVVRLLFNSLRPGNASTESHPRFFFLPPGSLQPAVPSQSFHLLLKIANSHLSHDTGEPITAAWRRDTRLRRDVDLSVRVYCWQSGSDSVECTAE